MSGVTCLNQPMSGEGGRYLSDHVPTSERPTGRGVVFATRRVGGRVSRNGRDLTHSEVLHNTVKSVYYRT